MTKGHEGTSRGDEYVHDFDYGDGFMGGTNVEIYRIVHFECTHFSYVHYTSIKLFTKFFKIFIYIKSLKV